MGQFYTRKSCLSQIANRASTEKHWARMDQHTHLFTCPKPSALNVDLRGPTEAQTPMCLFSVSPLLLRYEETHNLVVRVIKPRQAPCLIWLLPERLKSYLVMQAHSSGPWGKPRTQLWIPGLVAAASRPCSSSSVTLASVILEVSKSQEMPVTLFPRDFRGHCLSGVTT